MLKSKISENISTIFIYNRNTYAIHHSTNICHLRMSQGIFTGYFYIRNLTIGMNTPLNLLRVYNGGKLELILDSKTVPISPNVGYRLT